MPYGTIKVDTVTFTDAGIDKSVTLSGLVQNPIFSGNVTVTNTFSGVTVTGTTASFTSGNFTNISGGTHTIASGVFAAGSAASPSITFTGDLNTGIYSPGADQVSLTTGGTERLRVDSTGQIEAVSLGTAAAPVFSFTGDPNTGLYSPGADQLAISTNGTGRLFVDASGRVTVTGTTGATFKVGDAIAPQAIDGAGNPYTPQIFNTQTGSIAGIGVYTNDGTINRRASFFVDQTNALWGLSLSWSSNGLAPFVIRDVSAERLRIDSSGRLLVGTSSSADLNASVQSIGTTAYRFYGFRYGSDNGILTLGSANGTQASPSVLTSPNLNLGILQFRSHDGVAYQDGAWIFAVAESQWSSGNCPTRLVFSTTAASASTPTERLRIDSSGRLLVGTTSARENFFNNTSGSSANFQLEGATAASRTGSIVSSNNGTPGSVFILGHQRSGSLGGNGILAANDFIGTVSFQGADGSKLVEAAKIVAEVDGTPGQTAGTFTIGQTYRILTTGTTDFTLIGAADSNPGTTFTATGAGTGTGTAINTAGDMPGRLVLSTTADGASSPTERMRITSAGLVGVGTNSPGALFDLAANNDGATGTTANNTLRFTDLDTNTAADQPIGKIEWYSYDTSSPGARAVSYILSAAAGANSGGDIRFGVSTNAGTASEAARIDSSGRLLVGTSSAVTTSYSSGLIQLATPTGGIIVTSRDDSTVGTSTIIGGLSLWSKTTTNHEECASIFAQADGTYADGDKPTRLVFSTTADGESSPTERARIDSSGRLLVGAASARANWFNATGLAPAFQIEGAGLAARASITRNDNTANNFGLLMGKSRDTAYAIVSANDPLGYVSFQGADGAELVEGARIESFVDGTPGTNDMPGRLVFSTTADGAASPTERVRLTNTGALLVGTTATPTGASAGSITAENKIIVSSTSAGREQIIAGAIGTVTATTGTTVFTFSTTAPASATAGFVKLSVHHRASSNTPSNSPAAEYWFNLHNAASGACTINGTASIYEYTYVRATHFAFADLGGGQCTITLTNPTGSTLAAGSYKVEILTAQGFWTLNSVSST